MAYWENEEYCPVKCIFHQVELPEAERSDGRQRWSVYSTVVGRGRLQNNFSGSICSGVGIIHREGSILMHFRHYYGNEQTNWGIHGEKSAGEGSNDFLIFYICKYSTYVSIG